MAVSGKYMLCVRCKYLIVVLLMFFHRKCFGQVTFDCSTLQPQPANDFTMGTTDEALQYSVTVDQQYYQQSSTRRVVVNAGSLAFTSLYLQARDASSADSIGGWSSPYPSGYTITAGCPGSSNLDTIIKVGTEPAQIAVFEWKPPFADTSMDIIFVATFVNGGKYHIIVSEIITDPCNPSQCSTNETCFRGTASPGYFCAGCEEDFCQNGGLCIINSGEQPQCLCPSSFMGTRCQFVRGGAGTACASNPCLNGGSCGLQTDGSYICTCNSGYSGTRCEIPNTFCTTQGCLNGGTCIPIGNSAGSCSCTERYTGAQCERENPCFNFCQNGGSCIDDGNGATCQCPVGFVGTRCENTGDFCDHNLCQNGATCVNTPTIGFCICADGFTGPACDQVDLPGFCSLGLCENGATCIETTSGGSCLCAEGFTGSTCDSAQDRCSPNPCFNGGNCFNTPGEPFFLCVCASGYTGSLCLETPCTGEPCQNGGTCSVTQGSPQGYICHCGNFYLGTNCETVTPCASSPCQNGGQCTLSGGGFSCTCLGIWRGEHCDEEDYCRSRQPCQNGGTCLFLGHESYLCQCLSTFTGQNCQFENPCRSDPCQNGATCSETQGSPPGYSCQCAHPFVGTNCETVLPCLTSPCQNGGQCALSGGGFSCTCLEIWRGDRCDEEDYCRSRQPCQNGGTCSFLGHETYHCQCPPTFSGKDCQLGACSYSECVNGTCVEDARSDRNYRCECQEGFGGDFCDIVVDFCLAHKPCLNGGTCFSQGSSNFRCDCMDPYFGDDSCLFNRDNGPVFQDCVETTHTYQLRPDNTAFVNLNITAMVPETGQVIDFDVIVGPDGVTFPGDVTYTEDYLEGQKFVLRAMDQFERVSSCSFTIKLSDPIAPTVNCPGDHEDISSRDRVVVSSLPLPLIEASDNVDLPADNVFTYSPEEVNVDGQLREVTVSVYDVDGNRAECQFGLTLYKGDQCSSINTDNGRVNCSGNLARNRACEIRCNEGYLPPNGEIYTCRSNNWDRVPLPCLAIQEPNSFSKRITIVFSVLTSLCDQDEFLMNVTEAMKAKLTELDLCGQGSSASVCGENSITASCNNQNLRRKRQTTEKSELKIDVEISGSSRNDVTGLITSIGDEINEGFTMVVGGQTLELVNYNVTPQFMVACQSGSISRQEACLICPLGTYHHSASDECRQCGKGSFQDEVGQLQCKECGTSSYQDQVGQTSCIACDGGLTSDGVTCSSVNQNDGSWVQVVIYACVGVGALLVIIIFILMVCLWQSTQEEKKQDQKRWELGHSTQLNKCYEPEEETGFRPRVNTTVSATTYQTVPEGDGTPNLGNGVINGGHELVRIPTEELYSGLTVDTHGRTLTVGVDNHPAPQPRRYQYENGYHHSPANEFMSYGHDRHNFPV